GVRVAARTWVTDPPRPEPIVAVHGLVVSSAYMAPLADRLSDHRDVWAPDLPGFGASDKPDHVLDVRELGRALAGWIDAAGLRDVVLLGNSFGCQIVAETTLQRPDLVSRMVLLGPTMQPRLRSVPKQLRRWRKEQKTQSARLKALQVRDYAKAGIPRAITTFRHALHDRIEDKLPLLEQPTLVVRGTDDPIVEQDWVETVVGLLPDAELAVLPGATHAINHEQPAQTARAVGRFLHTR
ncbi:MAG TPA: alpha/beta hydrolase, partial [Egibacteraceae bacterium]|nr:alpha/beta hydrolase [Egibacteraceae bacterium]